MRLSGQGLCCKARGVPPFRERTGGSKDYRKKRAGIHMFAHYKDRGEKGDTAVQRLNQGGIGHNSTDLSPSSQRLKQENLLSQASWIHLGKPAKK